MVFFAALSDLLYVGDTLDKTCFSHDAELLKVIAAASKLWS